MLRIERKYAIVYIDNKGDTLNKENYITHKMVKDYYESPIKNLQWNFYLIIPSRFVKDGDKKEIENNDIYTRKYVVEDESIGSFLIERFPKFDGKPRHIKLIHKDNWKDAVIASQQSFKRVKKALLPKHIRRMGSFMRNYNTMYALEQFDLIRAKMIKDPEYYPLFYTNNEDEHIFAKRKFEAIT